MYQPAGTLELDENLVVLCSDEQNRRDLLTQLLHVRSMKVAFELDDEDTAAPIRGLGFR